LKVLYHAPPPGAPTGVADYAETLLEGLRGVAPANAGSDVPVYHLGNNRLHRDIYACALATPGVVVLHDAVLHHFLLGALSAAGYVEEFVYNYGEWSRHLGEELWRERDAASVDPRYFRYPMLRRAVESARAVIVHNPGAAEIARRHGAGNIRVIPHFFEPRDVPDGFAIERFRGRIGVAPGSTLFGIFGYLRETKRPVSARSGVSTRCARIRLCSSPAKRFRATSRDCSRAKARTRPSVAWDISPTAIFVSRPHRSIVA